jgi:D-alanyl-lipoteichoic acid acyltransferase DltB (MBOAT superfamily)
MPWHFSIEKIIYPLGLSYLVFKVISYLADVYWEKIEPGNFIDYFFYLSLFTIYTAGPIERFANIKPQIDNNTIKYNSSYLETGIYRIVIGLFKKLVISNWISYFLKDAIFFSNGDKLAGLNYIGLMIFSFQIYFDFSGYSDIAIGASKLFGLKIMENFSSPFLKKNISQFWQSWHISLSSWIRDYIYYPLSLSSVVRKIDFQITSDLSLLKLWNMVGIPIIAMIVCGLWHGIQINFLIWGCLHGSALALFQIWSFVKRKYNIGLNQKYNVLFSVIGIIITFCFVSYTWHFFIYNIF